MKVIVVGRREAVEIEREDARDGFGTETGEGEGT